METAEAIKVLEKELATETAMEHKRFVDAFSLAIAALREQETLRSDGVCGLCAYNPPSSGDGKPCTMCPATTRRK